MNITIEILESAIRAAFDAGWEKSLDSAKGVQREFKKSMWRNECITEIKMKVNVKDKLKGMRVTTTVLLLFMSLFCNATTYYFSGDGADGNPGTIGLPKATVSAASALTTGGNTILFERGFEYTGNLVINSNSVTIGAYGSGAKPIISGFTNLLGWTNEGGGIYSKVIASDAQTNMVTIDGVQYGMGRYPDATYLTYESYVTSVSITDNTLGGTPNWTGAEAAIRKNDWTLERCIITNHSVNTLTYTSTGTTQWGTANYGFFIQNDLRTLTTYGEWYHNFGTGKFSMYFGAVDPNTKQVKVATKNSVFTCAGYDNVTVSDISFTGSISNGMNFTGTTDTCNVSSCDVSFSGNMGIFLNAGSSDIFNLNTISNSNGNGFWTDATSTTFSNNTITSSGVIAGQCLGQDGFNGIYANGLGVNINHNVIRSSGSTGVVIRRAGTALVQYNLIDSSCTVTDDGGGIYTAGVNAAVRTLDHNIILNTIGNTAGTNHTNSRSEGIYLDEVFTNGVISNNTIASAGEGGIKLHKAHDVTITGNTTYNCFWGLNFLSQTYPDTIYNITSTGNIFFAKNSNQTTWQYNDQVTDLFHFGTSNSNYFLRPIDDNLTIGERGIRTGYTYWFRSLAQWQTLTGQDLLSKKSPKAITSTSELDFQYNATSSPVVYNFTGFRKMDKAGISYNNSYTIPAYESVVLIANGVTTNALPTANAGANQSITLPVNSTTLVGSGTDTDGTIVSYSWAKISGPATGSVISPNSATTGINNLVQGVYQFTLTVTDNLGGTGKDTVQVTVNANANVAPTSNAGPDQAITIPTTSITMAGSGSDPEGAITYAWAKTSGPMAYSITNFTQANTTVTGLIAGTYYFQLTVTGTNGTSTSDLMQVIVNPNLTPVPSTSIILYNWKF